MARINYQTMLEALAFMFGARDEASARIVFAMIGNLRKSGLPGGSPGPGKTYVFDRREAEILMVALTLQKHGVPPAAVADYVKHQGLRLGKHIGLARMEPDDLCLVIGIDRMSPRWTNLDPTMDITTRFWRTGPNLPSMGDFSKFLEGGGSGIVINLSAKLRELDVALREIVLAPLSVAAQ